MSTTLFGTIRTRASADPAQVSFSHDLAPGAWLSIPLDLIAAMETIATGTSRFPGHTRVRITLKDATTAEGKILESIVATLETSLRTLSRKVGPALEHSTTEASPACIRCLEQCRLIVVTADDPFAQILCMLNCADCP